MFTHPKQQPRPCEPSLVYLSRPDIPVGRSRAMPLPGGIGRACARTHFTASNSYQTLIAGINRVAWQRQPSSSSAFFALKARSVVTHIRPTIVTGKNSLPV